MLVLPPLSTNLVAQVLAAALTGVFVLIGSSIRRKTHAAKLLKPIPGPTGRFLFGFVLELAKNLQRIYDFQVQPLSCYCYLVMTWISKFQSSL